MYLSCNLGCYIHVVILGNPLNSSNTSLHLQGVCRAAGKFLETPDKPCGTNILSSGRSNTLRRFMLLKRTKATDQWDTRLGSELIYPTYNPLPPKSSSPLPPNPLIWLCHPRRSQYCFNYPDVTRLTISVIESSDEVASSYINMGGFFKIALAIAILCFSPPDSFKPRSPT